MTKPNPMKASEWNAEAFQAGAIYGLNKARRRFKEMAEMSGKNLGPRLISEAEANELWAAGSIARRRRAL